MSAKTYTPTHCPETGRKYTRAERRAANKAKFAQEQEAKRKAKPKAKKKPVYDKRGRRDDQAVKEMMERIDKKLADNGIKPKTAKQSRADVLCKQYGLTMEQMFDIVDACQTANTYTPVSDITEVERKAVEQLERELGGLVLTDPKKPAPKRTKTKRKTKNDKLEAQAQRLSNRASAKRNVRKTEVVCDDKPTAASPFGTRTEVDAPAPKAKAQHPADYVAPTPYAVLREEGYTDVMDMLRAVNMDMMDEGVTADDIL